MCLGVHAFEDDPVTERVTFRLLIDLAEDGHAICFGKECVLWFEGTFRGKRCSFRDVRGIAHEEEGDGDLRYRSPQKCDAIRNIVPAGVLRCDF